MRHTQIDLRCGATIMSNLPTMNLDQLPAAVPPPGVTPNLVNPDTQASTVFVTIGITVGLVAPAVIIRIFTKAYIIKTVNLEDCE